MHKITEKVANQVYPKNSGMENDAYRDDDRSVFEFFDKTSNFDPN